MIPSIIHYCWFGGRPLPDSISLYIDSWRKFLPKFQIKQWDESNFDVNSCIYTRQAYFAKRFAFVSDVARLYALITDGGLYLDTDILLKKPIPKEWFTTYKAFAGFEHDVYVQTGLLAAIPHHPFFEKFYKSYQSLEFFNGCRYDMTTNVARMTDLMTKAGFVMNNKFQCHDDFALFPQEILCAKDWIKGRYGSLQV